MAATWNSVNKTALGQGLTVASKLAVKNSLAKLQVQEKQPLTVFWGKVSGAKNDYLIAVSYTVTDSISKKFFFSADGGLNFAQLPAVDDFVAEKSALHRSLFTGNPSQILKDPKPKKVGGDDDEEEEEEEEEEEPEPEEDDEEGAVKKPKERKLNELERLAYTVERIENSTCIIPKGRVYLTPTSEIKFNMNASMASSDLGKLSSYFLLKNPSNPSTLACIRRDGATNNFNCLDPVGDGEPAGVWSIQVHANGCEASIRSLVWPGYEFKMSDTKAGCYFGNGLENEDVLFML